MRIKSGPTLVCFQEVSQLATEEVSIFRLMGPADRLSSLVVTRQAARFRVKSLCVFCAQEELIIHVCSGLCAYPCMPVWCM